MDSNQRTDITPNKVMMARYPEPGKAGRVQHAAIYASARGFAVAVEDNAYVLQQRLSYVFPKGFVLTLAEREFLEKQYFGQLETISSEELEKLRQEMEKARKER